MSISYYLFNKIAKECLYLGKKGVRDDFEFEGPLYYIGQNRYLLPVKYLELLIRGFKEIGNDNFILTVTGDELFDTAEYLGEDEEAIEIGGDSDLDLPLSKYLPELNDLSVREEIKKNGVLIA